MQPGFTMPAFSRAMSARVGPAYSVWSSPTFVTTATVAVGDVRGVPSPEQPDLDDGDVDRGVGERPVGGRGHDLEVGGPHAGDDLEVGDGADLLGERVVVDRLAVDGDALVDPLEVRARVGADPQALGHQQAGGDLGGRALAVRAGDVDHRVGLLRVAHGVDEAGHPIERGHVDARPASIFSRLVCVVEVGQRGLVVQRCAYTILLAVLPQ